MHLDLAASYVYSCIVVHIWRVSCWDEYSYCYARCVELYMSS